ncbi:MAG: CBS domain-containing protein [Flavobacteriales bacterium]
MRIHPEHIRRKHLTLRLSDSLYLALERYEEFKVSHLPVVSANGKYLGLLSETEVFGLYDAQKNIEDNQIPLQKDGVFETQSVLDALKLIAERSLTLLPVIDAEDNYLGYLLPLDVLKNIGNDTSFSEYGSLLSVKMSLRDYALNELSRIVESEDALITALFMEHLTDNDLILVHIKINIPDASAVVAALERHEYQVETLYQKSKLDEKLNENFHSFLKYLNP